MEKRMNRGFKWNWAVYALLALGTPLAIANQAQANPAIPGTEASAPGTAEKIAQRIPQRYGIFEEPLQPIGSSGEADLASLQTAIYAYQQQPDTVLTEPLEAWIAAHPKSPWVATLWLNMGLAHERAADYTEALRMLDKARVLGLAAHTPAERKVEARALAELLDLEMRLGHTERVAQLLKTSEAKRGDSVVIGTVVAAQSDMVVARERPEDVLRCGIYALADLYQAVDLSHEKLDTLYEMKAGKHGLNLAQVQKLAQTIGLDTRMIRRSADTPVPVPAVVHWKVGHYATILEQKDGRYRVRDTALKADVWMRREVLERQSSGYFLVANKTEQSPNWLAVTNVQATHVIGAGETSKNNPGELCNCHQAGGDAQPKLPKEGMPVYTVDTMLASLEITDTPVAYTAAKGPGISFSLVYNQLDVAQPATFSFSNLGPQWTHNWLSWVIDDPVSVGNNVTAYAPGGNNRQAFNYASATGTFGVDTKTGAVLARISDSDGLHYEKRMPDGSVWVYGLSDGATAYPRRFFLTRYTDPQGNSVTLGYDTTLRLQTVTDAAGQVSTLQYTNANPLLITGWTDPFGRTASIAYDANGRVSSLTDAVGMTSSFTYDSGSNITALTTPYGTTTFSTNYTASSPRNRWIIMTDPLGQTERVESNPNPSTNMLSTENSAPAGVVNGWLNYRNSFYWNKNAMALGYGGDYTKAQITHFLHDNLYGMNTLSGVVESERLPLESRVYYTYPGQTYAGQYAGTLDKPSGIYRLLDDGSTQRTLNTYNSIGNLTSTTDPMGRVTYYDYAGNLIDLLQVRQATASGYDTAAKFTYNSQHLPLTYTDAAGQVTTDTYDAAGNLTSVTNALGQTTTYVRDDLGHLLSEVNPNGQVAHSYTYDMAGRVATETDSEGYTVSYTYDNLDRLTQTSYPDGTTDSVTYDKLDVVSSTNRLGQTTSYEYDAVRQLKQETDPAGNVLQYAYHPGGQLRMLTDMNWHVTQWDIDLEGRVTAKHFADGTQQTVTYENNTSRIKSTTDALGQSRANAYTLDGQLKSVSYTGAVNTMAGTSWAWDSYYKRASSMMDGTGTTSYSYVPAGSLGALQLASQTGPTGNSTIAYTYDALGRVLTRKVDSSTESYAYDTLGRLTTHTTPVGQFNTSYLGETGQATQLSVAGTPYTTQLSYLDNSGDRRLSGITHSAPSSTPVRSYQYGSNAIGQITQRSTWSLNGSVAVGTADANHDYTYDPAGNITNITTPSASTDMTASNTNALLTYGTQAVTTDAVGNVTDDGEHTYKWDAQGRLLEIGYKAVEGQKTTFRYDGLGRRVAIIETATTGATPVEKRYLWCGEEICQERDQNDTVTKRFYPEGEYWVSGAQKIFYNRDNLGSVRDAQLLNTNTAWSDGTHSSSADYDAYGQGSGNGLTFQYAGMFLHQTSGLYLTHYRAYDPKRGRWVSRDPIAEKGGVNLYAYVEGDPVRNFDSLGLSVDKDGIHDDDVPQSQSQCFNACAKKYSNPLYWTNLFAGMVGGTVIGAAMGPEIGLGRVAGSGAGSAVGTLVSNWNLYQMQLYVDKMCKLECEPTDCKFSPDGNRIPGFLKNRPSK